MSKITASDPEALNAAAQLAMQSAQVTAKPVVDESSLTLPSTHVTLPGGYVTVDHDVVTEAEVRELDGADEEAFARSGNVGKSLLLALERGVVKVGDEAASRSTLDGMLSGDRDYLMLMICRATYGDEAEYRAQCPHCSEVQEVKLSLTNDIPVVRLVEPAERFFTVKDRGKEIAVRLPTGQTQREVYSKTDLTFAEINTLVLAGSVVTIDDMPSIGVSSVKKLGIATRQKVTSEIAKRNPGPRLNDVKKPCRKCDQEMPLALTMSELFRLA